MHIDSVEEQEIIKKVEQEQKQLLENDPMKELDEALMDRTTASRNRRKKIENMRSSKKSKGSDRVDSSTRKESPEEWLLD